MFLVHRDNLHAFQPARVFLLNSPHIPDHHLHNLITVHLIQLRKNLRIRLTGISIENKFTVRKRLQNSLNLLLFLLVSKILIKKQISQA